jgi:hypothetical protein
MNNKTIKENKIVLGAWVLQTYDLHQDLGYAALWFSATYLVSYTLNFILYNVSIIN